MSSVGKRERESAGKRRKQKSSHVGGGNQVNELL